MPSLTCPRCHQQTLSVVSTNHVSKGVRRFLHCSTCDHRPTSLETVHIPGKKRPTKTMDVVGWKSIGVKHIETGDVYSDVPTAAKALHLSESSIYQSARNGVATSVGSFAIVVEFLDKG